MSKSIKVGTVVSGYTVRSFGKTVKATSRAGFLEWFKGELASTTDWETLFAKHKFGTAVDLEKVTYDLLTTVAEGGILDREMGRIVETEVVRHHSIKPIKVTSLALVAPSNDVVEEAVSL